MINSESAENEGSALLYSIFKGIVVSNFVRVQSDEERYHFKNHGLLLNLASNIEDEHKEITV